MAEERPGRGVVAILEDDGGRAEAFGRALRVLEEPRMPVLFDSAPDFVAWLHDHLCECDLISLDHDLLLPPHRSAPGDGRVVADYLATREPACEVVIHTTNGPCGDSMEVTLQLAGWRPERVSPFSDLDWIELAWAPLVTRLLARRASTQELGQLMSTLSERCYRAGWLGGTEYFVPELCRRALATGTPQPWGHGKITPEEAGTLQSLAEHTGAWADLDESASGFLPFQPFPTPPEFLEALDRERDQG